MSYSEIIKKAFNITVQKPMLWVFGLFMLGGLNLNLFRFLQSDYFSLRLESILFVWIRTLPEKPVFFACAIFLAIILAAIILVLSNWSRIMLALEVEKDLKKNTENGNQIRFGVKKALWPVIKISILTSALMLAVGVILLSPPFILAPSYALQSFLWNLGIVIFLPLAFTIACLNIFSAFYIVIFKTTFKSALNLCTDFFISNWTKILGLGIILIMCYLAVFMIGRSVIFLIGFILRRILEFSGSFGDLHFSGMILLAKVFIWFLLWLLLSGLNVFYNTALLLFFLEMNKPIEKESENSKIAIQAHGQAL
jgi:hypothetical protein